MPCRRRHALPVRARLRRLSAEHAALRPAIEATGAVVTADLERLVNAIQVRVDPRRIGDLEKLPGVVRVDPVTVVTPALGQAVPLIGAPQVWQLSTPIRGQGVRIGILDSGIDYTHADFGGPGTVAAYQQNDPNVIEPGTFPTARVVGGWDFVGDTYDASNASTAIPKPDPDPLDCDHAVSQGQEISGGHGTHVTGIAAGNGVLTNGKAYTGPYDASLDPSAFKVFPGVAPEAQLYALKIFGCTGSTDQLAAALERASDPDQNGDFSDHLDVVNASLGTSYGLGSPAEADVIKNLTKVGTLLVVAAGNDGSAFYSAGSPGVYPEALSVAASASANLLAMTIDSPTSIQGDVAAAEGRFTTRLSKTGPITGTLVYAEPHDACATLTNAAALKGHIALIDRGTCSVPRQVQQRRCRWRRRRRGHGQRRRSPTDDHGRRPAALGVDPRRADPQDRWRAHPGGPRQGVTVTLDAGHRYTGPGSETLASFSSRGPSSSDNLLKPEVSAPGSRIKSAGVGSGSELAQHVGHVDGLADGHRGRGARAAGAARVSRLSSVKAALMNCGSADRRICRATTIRFRCRARDLSASIPRWQPARDGNAGTRPNGSVGLSFGAVITDKPYSDTRRHQLENHSTTPVDYQASNAAAMRCPASRSTCSPRRFSLAGGATQDVTVTLDGGSGRAGRARPGSGDPADDSLRQQHAEPRQFLNEADGHVVFTDGEPGRRNRQRPVRGGRARRGRPPGGNATGCAPARQRRYSADPDQRQTRPIPTRW